jgi:hypothetical protein
MAENNFGMRSIAEVQKKGFGKVYGEKLKEAYTHDWVFCGWERWIVLGSFLYTAYSIGRLIWGLL